METKPITFTYTVIFKEDVWCTGSAFIAGVEYTFKAKSESNHPGDMFDAAYDGIHELFGLIDSNEDGTMIGAPLPINDPIIKSWEDAV